MAKKAPARKAAAGARKKAGGRSRGKAPRRAGAARKKVAVRKKKRGHARRTEICERQPQDGSKSHPQSESPRKPAEVSPGGVQIEAEAEGKTAAAGRERRRAHPRSDARDRPQRQRPHEPDEDQALDRHASWSGRHSTRARPRSSPSAASGSRRVAAGPTLEPGPRPVSVRSTFRPARARSRRAGSTPRPARS